MTNRRNFLKQGTIGALGAATLATTTAVADSTPVESATQVFDNPRFLEEDNFTKELNEKSLPRRFLTVDPTVCYQFHRLPLNPRVDRRLIPGYVKQDGNEILIPEFTIAFDLETGETKISYSTDKGI